MDWHCEDITNAPNNDYYSVNAHSPTPISNLIDAEAYCQTQGMTAKVIQVGDQTLTAIIQQVMEIPIQTDLQQIWMTGFALPVICYLTAWGFQTVIGWFDTRG